MHILQEALTVQTHSTPDPELCVGSVEQLKLNANGHLTFSHEGLSDVGHPCVHFNAHSPQPDKVDKTTQNKWCSYIMVGLTAFTPNVDTKQ